MSVARQPRLAGGTAVGGRYEVQALVGAGASGAVYRSKDTETEGICALKLVAADAFHGQTLHEYRILARLSHPGCVTVRDVGVDPDHGPYLVMDFVTGLDPRLAVDAASHADVHAFASRVLHTLDHLHGHGVLHGDLKPQNVRCVEGDPARPVLLDFGLATGPATDNMAGGTVRYMAPELFAGRSRDLRSDLYAVGVMLYELLAGTPPFMAPSITGLVQAHMFDTPPPLSERAPTAHPAFVRLVEALLRKDPADRPATAHEALIRLAEITGEDLESVTEEAAVLHVGEPALVGRGPILERFDAVWKAAADGEGSAVLVHGPPGSGRSRVIDELAVRGRLAGACVVRGSAADLSGPGRRLRDVFSPVLRDATSAVHAELMPLLEALADDSAASHSARAERLLATVHATAAATPILLLLDDLNAAPRSAVNLVAGLVSSVTPAAALVVLAADEPTALGDAPLTTLELTPLGAPEVEEVLRTALGTVDGAPELATWLAEESAGNPTVVLETLRWLVHSGRVRRRRGSWYVASDLASDSDSGGALDKLAERRLQYVPESARGFLSAAAVLGLRFDPDIVAAATDLQSPDDSVWVELLRRRIVRHDAADAAELRFAQRGLRRMLEAEVPESDRAGLHAAAARRLMERAGSDDADELARLGVLGQASRHLSAAGDWDHGARFALTAAERAAASADLDEARALLQFALVHLPESRESTDTRRKLLTKLGAVEQFAGNFEEARAAFGNALEASDGDAPGLWLELGRTELDMGQYEDGQGWLRRVLDAADVSDDLRFEAGYILADTLRLLGRYDEAWELAGAATVVAERHDAVLGTDDLQGRVRQLRGNIRWASGDWEAALVEYRGALISLERGHHPERVAETRMAVGNAQRHLARYDEALRSYRVAASTFRELGRLSMVGKCENNIAITHYYKGNWRAASEHFERFLRILERTGELIERARLHNNLGTLYRDRGYLDRSRELLEEGLDVARRCGARRLEATALGNLGETLLRQGALDEAAECLEMTVALSRELGALDEELEAKRRQLELALERDDGSFDEAVALTTAQQAETADVKLEAANVLRLVAQARLRAGDPSGADEVIGDAKQLLAGSGVALEMLRVRRVEAQVLAASGRVEEALSLLEDVLERLERMDAGWDLSETAGVMADLVRGPGQEDEPVRLTSSHLAAITRFATRAAQVEDKQAFLDDALRRIMEVIPADRGVVVTIDEGGRATAKAVRHRSDDAPDDAEVEFSRSICAQALSERRSVFVPVASAAAEFRSISSVGRLGLRTVMATPISREGHARGVLYLDSSTPCDKELEGAVALMEALAAIVGAGLVHAEMAEEARQRSEGLAVLVHELKAPITTTYGYLQLLRMDADELPEDMQSCLDVAHTELARLKRMVADIGKLSRLETHDTLHTAVQIHVPKLLRTVVRNLTAQWGAKGLDVAVEADDKLAHVIGDRDQLVQVITNLLTNAIKFTPDRGRIWLRAREVLRRETTELGPMLDPFGGNTVDGRPVSEIEISVQDSGPGIPPGAFEKIFALFGQSGGTKTRQKGMGIGLAVARHLVRRHGGRIWAENAMTGGAVFTFTLPVVRTSAYI